MKRPGFENDWIIFKLKKPVSPSIKPYHIAKNPDDFRDQKNLVQVAKSVDFNPTHVTKMVDGVRHYSRCQKQYSELGSNLMETDCDASHGSSGGGMFTPGENPTLLAIVSAVNQKPCPDGNGTKEVGEYRHGCWASLATRVSGDLDQALRKIEAAPPPPAAKPSDPKQLYNDL